MANAAQLKALRKKFHLGEFRKGTRGRKVKRRPVYPMSPVMREIHQGRGITKGTKQGTDYFLKHFSPLSSHSLTSSL